MASHRFAHRPHMWFDQWYDQYYSKPSETDSVASRQRADRIKKWFYENEDQYYTDQLEYFNSISSRCSDPFFDQYISDESCYYTERDWNKFMTDPIFILALLSRELCWYHEDRQDDYYCYNTNAECKDQDHDILNCPNFKRARIEDTSLPELASKVQEVDSILSTLIKKQCVNNFEKGVEKCVIGIKKSHGTGIILKASIHTSCIEFSMSGYIKIDKMSEADCLAFDLSPYMGSH